MPQKYENEMRFEIHDSYRCGEEISRIFLHTKLLTKQNKKL